MTLTFPPQLTIIKDTRKGRMLAAGDIRVTVNHSAYDTLCHEPEPDVTIRFKAQLDNRVDTTSNTKPRPDIKRNWIRVPLVQATHVFIEVPKSLGEYPAKVGTFYPKTGKFYPDKEAAPVTVTAAIQVAHWLIESDQLDTLLQFTIENNCGVCGAVLHDSISIERGIDTGCYNNAQQNTQLLSRDNKIEKLLSLIIDDMQAATNRDLACDGPVGNEEESVWQQIESLAQTIRSES